MLGKRVNSMDKAKRIEKTLKRQNRDWKKFEKN